MRNKPELDSACLPYCQLPVVAGLSGGRDSVALLRLLALQGFTVHACHIHHGIRGADADGDADFCAKLCQRLNVPFECVHVDVPALARQNKQSLETAARLARRRILADAARRAGGCTVALAHHAGDQAETILFRLARGAAGPRGMQPICQSEGIIWLRPLLHCPRETLTIWLQEIGQTWREDATNAESDIARNRIRHEVIPALNKALGRDVVPILNRSARLQAETLDALEESLSLLPLDDPQGRLYLPFVLQQPLPLRKAILRRYLSRHGVADIQESMVLALDSILPAQSPTSRLCLPGGKIAIRRQKRLIIC